MAESEIKSTRLRFIGIKDPTTLSLMISTLPFKVEIKGAPVWNGTHWILWFVIPDNVPELVNVLEA